MKTVLVTGASRGIGRSIALKFAKEGYTVIINSKESHSLLLELKKEILSLGSDCIEFLGDVGDYSFVDSMFKELSKRFLSLDVLVNNAGISYIGLVSDMTFSEWYRLIKTNLTSVFNCCSHAIPLMLSKKSGSIINISSIWGNVGASCEVAYSASKGGVNAFTRALAKELAPSGISVNAVACGVINTSMNACFSAEELSELTAEIPVGRFGEPKEVADFVFELSKASPYLTGQIVTLDGGFT